MNSTKFLKFTNNSIEWCTEYSFRDTTDVYTYFALCCLAILNPFVIGLGCYTLYRKFNWSVKEKREFQRSQILFYLLGIATLVFTELYFIFDTTVDTHRYWPCTFTIVQNLPAYFYLLTGYNYCYVLLKFDIILERFATSEQEREKHCKRLKTFTIMILIFTGIITAIIVLQTIVGCKTY
jgi:hypothetical protein